MVAHRWSEVHKQITRKGARDCGRPFRLVLFNGPYQTESSCSVAVLKSASTLSRIAMA
jgi:hypothetical protein